MQISDPLGDMLTRIRNGQNARLAYVTSPASNLRISVLEVLKKEGYIREFSKEELRPGIEELKIELKYVGSQPVIREIGRFSRPGRRVFSAIKNLDKYYNGLGISILSTSKGVMSDRDARIAKVGGEVLCKVF
jgi:small subunit ribosomal protein S8